MKTFLICILAVGLASSACGADMKGVTVLGVRLGVGHVSQSAPDEVYSNYDVSAQANGFYTEAFFNWHFLSPLALEVALAAFNHGDFRFNVPEGNFFGTVNTYPIMVGLKAEPLATTSSRYQPYFSGGGSVVVGRALIEGGTVFDPYLYVSRSLESETHLGWWLGTGLDVAVAHTIMLTSSFRYQGIKFSNPVGGFKDHSGYLISFGVAYIFRKS